MDAIRDLDISKYRTSADSPYLDPTHSIHFFCWIFETTARGVALGTPLGSENVKSNDLKPLWDSHFHFHFEIPSQSFNIAPENDAWKMVGNSTFSFLKKC